jgi:hypothetical protein
MMNRCAAWMMSLGWAGLLLGVLVLAALALLVVLLISRVWGGSPRP